MNTVNSVMVFDSESPKNSRDHGFVIVKMTGMGTKMQCKYYQMNDINDNSNVCNWPLFYGDKSVYGFFSTPSLETYPGGEKDVVKLTMLGHEATFKNQVYELHRLYRIQRDMMNEFKRKEFTERQRDGFLSGNLSPSQIAPKNVQKCHFTSSNVAYSSSNQKFGPYPSRNDRSTKSRKMLDLQLPAEVYMESDEDEQAHDLNKPMKLDDFTRQASKPLLHLLGLSRETSLNSGCGSNKALQNNHGMFSDVLEADRGNRHSACAIKDGDAQIENHRSLIPWLKAMPSGMNGAENSSSLKKVLSDVFVGRSLESGSKKILGFTIFDESRISKNDFFPGTNPRPPSEVERGDENKIRALDINMPCDPSVPDAETLRSHTVSNSKHQIDLNISLSDNEELFDIDLEAPAIPESTDTIIVEEIEKIRDELVKMAAEAIVSISSSKNLNEEEEDDSPTGSLPWFVDIALNDESLTEWIDHFEAMTLNLKELTEEEYMPKPPFPNESINFSQTQLRRAPSRRGRQRRAFRRDILPGLTTLSRHEVTEDLQTFSGLMRATGHTYSGLSRRNSGRSNGGGRGRRKAVVTPSPLQNTSVACKVKVGVEDQSLAGWGTTTRRPRRQRIPAGNLNVAPLS